MDFFVCKKDGGGNFSIANNKNLSWPHFLLPSRSPRQRRRRSIKQEIDPPPLPRKKLNSIFHPPEHMLSVFSPILFPRDIFYCLPHKKSRGFSQIPINFSFFPTFLFETSNLFPEKSRSKNGGKDFPLLLTECDLANRSRSKQNKKPLF